jgi:DNA-binding NarL/FixJ family response regulator
MGDDEATAGDEPDLDRLAWPRSLGEELVTQVYLTLLRQRHPSRASLIGTGFLGLEVDQALAILEEQHLVEVTPEGHVHVYPPDVALPAFAAELERQARTSRAAAGALARVYRDARAEGDATSDPDVFDVRLLRSIDEVNHARMEITPTARKCITRLVARSAHADGIILEQPRLMRTARTIDPDLPPGARVTVFESSLLDLDGGLTTLRALQEDGIDVRLAPSVPFTVIVIDETAALLDISNIEPSGYGSILVRHGPLVRAISGLTDCIVTASSPLPRSRPVSGHPLPSQRDLDVLALLAAGASDSVIARKTRVSQRTVERRVRALMDALSASTRFQAGVEAARRGLV